MLFLNFLKTSIGKPPYEFWEKMGLIKESDGEEKNMKIAKTLSQYVEWAVENDFNNDYTMPTLCIIIKTLRECPEENIVDFEKLADFVKCHYEKNFPHFRNIQKHEKIDADAEWIANCADDIIEILKNE